MPLYLFISTKKCRYIFDCTAMAVFGVQRQHLALWYWTMLSERGAYFVLWFLLTDLCKRLLTYQGVTGTATSRFSLLHLIRPAGRIFVFNRTRQVVFWASRNDFGCSKQLALPGAEKHLPKSGFCVNYKWICDERKQQKTIKKDRTPT